MPNEGKDTAWDQGHELAHDENRQRGAVDPSEAGTQQLIKRLLASLSAVQAVGQASADHRPVHPGTESGGRPRGSECPCAGA